MTGASNSSEKRPATTNMPRSRFNKFPRPTQREKDMKAKKDAMQEEAKEAAVQKSKIDSNINPLWKQFLMDDDD